MGIVYADHVTTVSPTYALDMLTETLGCGLDGVLRQRANPLIGILNGYDSDLWNPATDPHIENYSIESLAKKWASKVALCQSMGLTAKRRTPLFAS